MLIIELQSLFEFILEFSFDVLLKVWNIFKKLILLILSSIELNLQFLVTFDKKLVPGD